MQQEQELLKAILKIRSELLIKLTMLQENLGEKFPKIFIDGMECAFLQAIRTVDINTKPFYEKD